MFLSIESGKVVLLKVYICMYSYVCIYVSICKFFHFFLLIFHREGGIRENLRNTVVKLYWQGRRNSPFPNVSQACVGFSPTKHIRFTARLTHRTGALYRPLVKAYLSRTHRNITHLYKPAVTHPYRHTQADPHVFIHTRSHTHTHMHIPRTHTLTHRHTHVFSCSSSSVFDLSELFQDICGIVVDCAPSILRSQHSHHNRFRSYSGLEIVLEFFSLFLIF